MKAQRFHVADPALEGTDRAGTFGPCDEDHCADPHEDQADCEMLARLEPEGEAYGHTRHQAHQVINVKGAARTYALICDHLSATAVQHPLEPVDFDHRAQLVDAGSKTCDCTLEEWSLADWNREAARLNAAGKEQQDRRRPGVGSGSNG